MDKQIIEEVKALVGQSGTLKDWLDNNDTRYDIDEIILPYIIFPRCPKLKDEILKDGLSSVYIDDELEPQDNIYDDEYRVILTGTIDVWDKNSRYGLLIYFDIIGITAYWVTGRDTIDGPADVHFGEYMDIDWKIIKIEETEG